MDLDSTGLRDDRPRERHDGQRPPRAYDWDGLADALQEIIAAAIPLLRADGAGLMLADRRGELRWVAASNEAELAFEQAQRDLGEGPCIDAFTTGRLLQTADLLADPPTPAPWPPSRWSWAA